MKLFVLGTGCCGFLRIYTYLRRYGISYKGDQCKWQNSSEKPICPTWNDPKIESYLEKITSGDIGPYILNSVELIKKRYPESIFICLKGDESLTVKSLHGHWGFRNPLTMKREEKQRCHYQEYPDLRPLNYLEACQEFYKLYYDRAEKLKDTINDFYIVDSMNFFTDEIYRKEILSKCNIHDTFPNYEINYDISLTTSFSGGLGNILFQMSETIAFGEEHHLNYFFNFWRMGDEFPRYYGSDKPFGGHNIANRFTEIFPALKFSNVPASYDLKYMTNNMFDFKEIHPYRHHILKILKPSDDIIEMIKNKYHPDGSISIHFRFTGLSADTLIYDQKVEKEWYQRQMNKFPGKRFILISDRNDLCRQMFPNGEIIDEDPFISIIIMSMTDGHIIPHSTFSWWGAYLNPRQPVKTILHPLFLKYHEMRMIPYPEWEISE